MGNRMRFLEEQADKDAVKIVIMCAKNTVQSRLESTNGSGFYSISDLPKHGKAAHKLQQICRLFTWHKKNWVSLKTGSSPARVCLSATVELNLNHKTNAFPCLMPQLGSLSQM